MTPAEHAAMEVLRIFESGDHERIRDLVTPDFVDHGAPPGLPPGPEGYIGVLRFLTEVLQIRYEVHDVVAAGDRVAIRATAHGVHHTDHLGVPATGKPYAMPTMHLYRAEGDPAGRALGRARRAQRPGPGRRHARAGPPREPGGGPVTGGHISA